MTLKKKKKEADILYEPKYKQHVQNLILVHTCRSAALICQMYLYEHTKCFNCLVVCFCHVYNL